MQVDGEDFRIAPKGHSVTKIQSASAVPKLTNLADALKVVVIKGKPLSVFYGMVNQEGGLCEAINIDADEVFFFEQYRIDNLTDMSQRKARWSELIRANTGGYTTTDFLDGRQAKVNATVRQVN